MILCFSNCLSHDHLCKIPSDVREQTKMKKWQKGLTVGVAWTPTYGSIAVWFSKLSNHKYLCWCSICQMYLLVALYSLSISSTITIKKSNPWHWHTMTMNKTEHFLHVLKASKYYLQQNCSKMPEMATCNNPTSGWLGVN